MYSSTATPPAHDTTAHQGAAPTDTEQFRFLRVAAAGEAWVLTCRIRLYEGVGGMCEHVGVFTDPRAAIHDLASLVRPHWAREHARATAARRWPQMPQTPPEDDAEVVAWYFAKPGHDENRVGFSTFSLERYLVNTRQEPPGREYVLVAPFGEFTCVCGNTPVGEGFDSCNRDGVMQQTNDDTPWDGHVRCGECGRIIVNDTGLVVGTVPAASTADDQGPGEIPEHREDH